jgi:glycosyltransferase involved in cell wall biosynthesis
MTTWLRETDYQIGNRQAKSANVMKIVRIIARLNVGGPARHVVWLSAGLRNAETETLLVAGTVPSGEEDMGYFADQFGVKPLLIPEMSREVSLKDALIIWKLYRLFLRERPDIVHTHTAKAGTVGRIAGYLYRWTTPAALLGRPRQCRFVHTYHGHIFHSYYGPLKTRLFLFIEKCLARLITDRIIVVSEQQRREIHETFGVGRTSQFVVVPLGLDTGYFAHSKDRGRLFREEIGVKADDVLVGIVGRLTEIKNHQLFLRALKNFQDAWQATQPAVRFVVIGDGNLRGQLEAEAKFLRLDGLVFAGSRKDPENFYPALDVVALTSRNEGTPLTLIEAMANGRPVIATAVGGVVDLLGDTNGQNHSERYTICQRGISVPSNDPDAFAAGLSRLIEDPDLRYQMGNRGLDFVVTNYSKDRLLNDIRALYRDLLQRKPAPVQARGSQSGLESRV